MIDFRSQRTDEMYMPPKFDKNERHVDIPIIQMTFDFFFPPIRFSFLADVNTSTLDVDCGYRCIYGIDIDSSLVFVTRSSATRQAHWKQKIYRLIYNYFFSCRRNRIGNECQSMRYKLLAHYLFSFHFS